MPIPHILFQNIKEEGILPNPFYDASITLTPTKDIIKLQTNILNKDVKIQHKILAKSNPIHLKK